MTWTRLGDEFEDECWTLSDAAYRLHTAGLIWSNRKGLDCVILREDVQRFKRPDALQELLDGGWWIAEGDNLRIIHHAGYQRLREQVIAQSLANQRNGKLGGRPPKSKPLSDSQTDSVPAGRPPDRATETQSQSDSPSETESERDRPGLAVKGDHAGTTDLPAKPVQPAGCNECQRRVGMGGKPECPVIARGAVCPFPALDIRKAS